MFRKDILALWSGVDSIWPAARSQIQDQIIRDRMPGCAPPRAVRKAVAALAPTQNSLPAGRLN
jgi:hypothetical protein